MISEGDRWTLRRGSVLLGSIEVGRVDMPWVYGSWSPEDGFAEVDALFREERRLFELRNWPAWDRHRARIVNAGVSLHRPDGSAVTGFIVHIDDDEASFRWMDDDSPREPYRAPAPPDDPRAWFEERDYTIEAHVDEAGTVWVGLRSIGNPEFALPRYARGTSREDAERRAVQRWRVEQIGTDNPRLRVDPLP